VVNEAHQGLKGAVGAVHQGVAWQCWRVNFVRNALESAALGADSSASHLVPT
jgi:transposase-like protein